LFLGRGELDRADVAGRPGGTEQIFRGRVRLRQLDVEEAVSAHRGAVRAGRGVGLAVKENLGGLGQYGRGHGELLLLDVWDGQASLKGCD